MVDEGEYQRMRVTVKDIHMTSNIIICKGPKIMCTRMCGCCESHAISKNDFFINCPVLSSDPPSVRYVQYMVGPYIFMAFQVSRPHVIIIYILVKSTKILN